MPGRRHRRSGRACQGEENAVLVKQGRRAGTGMVHGQTRKGKDSPCKKDRRTAATVQRPAAFRKTQPDTVFSLTERPPKRKKFFSEFENGGTET